MNARCSSIQISRSPRRELFPKRKLDLYRFRAHRSSAARKRAHSRNAPSSCSRIARRGISRSGFSYYYGERDYEKAMKEFAIARRGLPKNTEVYLAIGAIQRRQGKWKESTANLEKAARLSPNETWPLQNLALNYERS